MDMHKPVGELNALRAPPPAPLAPRIDVHGSGIIVRYFHVQMIGQPTYDRSSISFSKILKLLLLSSVKLSLSALPAPYSRRRQSSRFGLRTMDDCQDLGVMEYVQFVGEACRRISCDGHDIYRNRLQA